MTMVGISGMEFGESQYQRGGKVWKASSLYLFAKAKGYPVKQLPLWAINLTTRGFDADNLRQFIFQCKRVNDCSLEHPILLDDCGQIADGYHRVCKAILEGRDTIDAIRLEEMPACDDED